MTRMATVVAVASTSDSSKTYRVYVDASGPIFCDCPGHKYARHGVRKPCKHMVALGADRDIDAAARALTATSASRAAVILQQVKRSASRFTFLEVAVEDDAGGWLPMVNLQRIEGLEV